MGNFCKLGSNGGSAGPPADLHAEQATGLTLYGLIPGMPLRERLREAIAAASTRSARDEIRRRLIGAGAEAYAAHAARGRVEHARQALLGEFAYAVRLLRDWRDGLNGLHRQIGDGRTANFAMGLAGAGFARIASLPLPDRAKTPAVLAAARGFAAALRGVEDGYWERGDAPDLISRPLAEATARIERLLQEPSDEEGVAQLSEIVPCATRS